VRTGLFLTFEGPEGAGKTTQIKLLASALQAAGHDFFVTREPGGTRIGEAIRSILLDHDNYAMLPETEALLHTAARSQHVGEKIRPALENGSVVLCDRFVDSTLAYQGGGRGLAIDRLGEIQELATGGLRPDLTILLDLPVEVGLARRFQAAGEVNRIDNAGRAFHERVRATYLGLSRQDPERWVVIDADREVGEVAASVLTAVAERTSLFSERHDAERAPGSVRAVADI
jgi:dTMP kinase